MKYGLPMFGGYNLPVRALNLHFLSVPPKSVHYSMDLSMVDPMGRPILAKKLHRAGALFLSLLGFEGRTVYTATYPPP